MYWLFSLHERPLCVLILQILILFRVFFIYVLAL
jgi:hypothetical protein